MLKAPFPWFGGKSRVADLVWSRFGDVPNYCEPFFGSGAVLLARPHAPRAETVNDKDAYVSNFWRALQHDPGGVAHYADWPVNEADLHARHLWLVNTGAERVERLKTDPDYYDVQVAGWWVWGISQWIGTGWCSRTWKQMPHLGDAGMGVHRKMPHLRDAGTGVHRQTVRDGLAEYLHELAARLRYVRICCGDWTRIMGQSPTYKQGTTGVFLDPPYSVEAGREADLYAVDTDVSAAVREWAIANGDNPELRIALCGYEGEHEMPEDWDCVEWKTKGGYGSLAHGRGRANSERERIWFSPACLDTAAGKQERMYGFWDDAERRAPHLRGVRGGARGWAVGCHLCLRSFPHDVLQGVRGVLSHPVRGVRAG